MLNSVNSHYIYTALYRTQSQIRIRQEVPVKLYLVEPNTILQPDFQGLFQAGLQGIAQGHGHQQQAGEQEGPDKERSEDGLPAGEAGHIHGVLTDSASPDVDAHRCQAYYH